MKKRLQKAAEFFSIVAIAIVLAIIFGYLGNRRRVRPQEPISLEDNRQMNEIEQYHLSVGHDIKFAEDIFNY